jgi:hypothetical protein
MMKRICLVLVFTLLAGGVVASKSRLKNFYSKESKVGFKYLASWKFEPGESSTVDDQGFKEVATVSTPEGAYARTNFVGARATLSVASVPETTCKQFPPSGDDASPRRRVGVGNNMFYLVTGSEGAVGHVIETRTYRTFHDGRCYQFDLTLDVANMGNYDKGTVRAVNDRKVFANLEAIVRSLYF